MKPNSTMLAELYGRDAQSTSELSNAFHCQTCPFRQDHQCKKMKGGARDVSMGTCSIQYHKQTLMTCPHRILENQQIFIDCLHLLHFEPGDTLYAIPETQMSSNKEYGRVDYCLMAMHNHIVRDYVGMEIQTLSTTGSIWQLRQELLFQNDLIDSSEVPQKHKTVTVNWKKVAKDILVQMQHKSKIFETYQKPLVLVIQTPFWQYLQKEFNCSVFHDAMQQDTVHLHTYNLEKGQDNEFHLGFDSQYSTTAEGIAKCLEQNENPQELYDLEAVLAKKACDKYRLHLVS